MRQISIGIDSWIIQDGNYGDFAVGDRQKFALEFAGDRLTSCTAGEPSAQLVHTSVYRVRANVIFVDSKVWVIDFGLRAFWESEPPAFVQVGSWVEGEVFIGLDPFFYMAYLHEMPDMPNLHYNWRVDAISRDDTPWLSTVNEGGGVTLTRDAARTQWTQVQKNLACEEGEERSSYILRCDVGVV